MRFNDKYFSFPPYISTSWKHVAALHTDENLLVVHLNDGDAIAIPGLKPEIIELIFGAHAAFLEKDGTAIFTSNHPNGSKVQASSRDGIVELPFKFGVMPFDGGVPMQHNPEFAKAPDLPKEMVQKIASITKILAGDDPNALPKGEPHCNCFYCQIARATHQDDKQDIPAIIDETVLDNELLFQQWEIKQAGEQLFTVTNKLDNHEHYNVFLGEPVGCTCGRHGCEHIIAVLNS